MNLRHITPDDYTPIIHALDDWWGGRPMRDMLPKLFFVHFRDTSFVAEENGQIAGFLAGFFSPALSDEAYIHFVGVNPACRQQGVGRLLYARFFEAMRKANRSVARCVTSPINTASIAFHMRMGFAPAASETHNAQGIPFAADYDGPGEHRVLFSRGV